MSENIYQLLNKVMEEVGAVSKREKNQQQNFNFRGVDSVVNAVSPALRKHGVVVFPEVIDSQYSSIEVGQRRTLMGHCRVTVKYTFAAPDGSTVSAVVAAESMDSGDKATAKAMSVAFRTALLQTLCLPTDEQDPDHDVYERSPKATDRGEQPPTNTEPTFEERYAKFKTLCAAEGINPQTILDMAGITEPSEKDLPQLRETFKAYSNHLKTQKQEGKKEEHEARREVAEAVHTLKKAFSMPVVDDSNQRKPSSNRPASSGQVGKLQGMYRERGYDQVQRLEHASKTLGVPIASFNDLTVKQASQLIDTLGG